MKIGYSFIRQGKQGMNIAVQHAPMLKKAAPEGAAFMLANDDFVRLRPL
jgi:hypothetical protein